MTGSELGTTTVPAFLAKLWTLVEDPLTNELIAWDSSGKSFHVLDQGRFAKEILPLYFKHNNMASFIRQLNMYGFRKVITVEAANVKMERDNIEFAHPCFVQGQEGLLEFIKRKAPNPKSSEGVGGVSSSPEELTRVYADVAAMKGRQDSMTTKLDHLKIENEVLWKELISLRQRHLKQGQIVNKLIQFLVTLVGDRTLGGMKRKFPLMLQDAASDDSSVPAKVPRMSDVAFNRTKVSADLENNILEPLAILNDVTTPALELTDLLDDLEENPMAELFDGRGMDVGGEDGTNELLVVPAVTEESRLQNVELTDADIPALNSALASASSPITTIATTDNNLYNSDFDKGHMTTHLDTLQSDIDNIRDLFLNGQYSFDSGTLFELFNPDPTLLSTPKVQLFSPDASYRTTPNLFLEGDEDDGELGDLQKLKSKTEQNGSVVGNELIQYNPPEDFTSLFEQFNSDVPSFADSIGLPVQDDLEHLFDTNQLLSENDLDPQ